MVLLFALLSGAMVDAAAAHAAGETSTAVQKPVSAAHRALARQAAELAQPKDLVVESAIAALSTAHENFAKDPEMASIEAEFPGFLKEYLAAALPELRGMLAESVPDLWKRLAAIYETELSEPELADMHRFLESPLGRKLVRIGIKASDDAAVRDMTLTEDMTAKDARNLALAGGVAIAKELSPDELAEMLRFVATPAGKALKRITPKIQASVVEWSNHLSPAHRERMGQIALRVLEDMISRQKGAGQ